MRRAAAVPTRSPAPPGTRLLGRHGDGVELAGDGQQLLGRGLGRTGDGAQARLSAAPKVTMPTTVVVRRRLGDHLRGRRRRRSPSSAAAWSMTTSSSARRPPLDQGDGLSPRLVPSSGRRRPRPVAHGLAVLVDELGEADDVALGARRRGRRDGADQAAATRSRSAPWLLSKAARAGPRRRCVVDAPNRSSKDLLMVSVSTKVPAMKATPRITASRWRSGACGRGAP